METETNRTRRVRNGLDSSKWLIRFVEAVIPPEHRELLLENLRPHDRPAPELLCDAAWMISGDLAGRTRNAFYIRMVLIEVCLLYLPFLGTPLKPALAIIGAALVAFRLRDAWTSDVSLGGAATDFLAGGSFAVASQIFFIFAAPPLAMSPSIFASGTAMGLIMAAFWRLFFRLKTPSNEPEMRRVLQSQTRLLRILVMWMIACATLILSNVEAVPGGHMRDFLYGFLPFTAFFVAYKLQQKTMGSVLWPTAPEKIIFGDPVETELTRRRDALWLPSELFWSQCFEAMFFIILAIPQGIAVWRWFEGTAANVDWRQVGVNTASLVTLLVLWTLIKRLSRKVASALDEQIALNRLDTTGLLE